MEADPNLSQPAQQHKPYNKKEKAPITFSHFLAFPLWDNYALKIKEVQDKFAAFVVQKYPQHVKDYRFQGYQSQHLTIAMLLLDTEDKKQIAIKALQAAIPRVKAAAQGGLQMKLTGVETFPDSAEKRIYYLDLDHSCPDYQKFLSVEDAVIRTFQEHGLLSTKAGGVSNLKILPGTPPRYYTTPHATFLRVGNYVKDRNFNRTILPKIVSEFNKTHLQTGFGEVQLDKIDICIRFDFGPKGEYNHLARIPLA